MVTPETTTPVPRSLRDPHPFDRLVTLARGGAPRRRVLQGLLSAALVGVPGTRQHESTAAKPCKGVGKRCQSNDDCCAAFCEPISRQCVATCDQGQGVCGTLAPCAEGCSCYNYLTGQLFSARACLQDPSDDVVNPGQECPGTEQCAPNVRNKGGCPCSSPADCPKGYLCTASSCCQPDSVCLPLCEPDSA